MNLVENGFSNMANAGYDGGQKVPHLHFHLLGREEAHWEKALQEK